MRRERTTHYHQSECRLPVFVATLVLTIPGAVSAECSVPAPASAEMPAVAFLRSYRASLEVPGGLAVDDAGRVYVAAARTATVVVRLPSGRIAERVSGLGAPVSVAAGPGGRIYVGDSEAGRVTAYGPDWTPLLDLGRGAGEFELPTDISVDLATGRVYVADGPRRRVNAYDSQGRFLLTFGATEDGDGALGHPGGVFVDSAAARVVVADAAIPRLVVYGLDGSFLTCIGREGDDPGEFTRPAGVWADATGRLYVADAFQGTIQVLDANGAPLGFIGSFGHAPGSMRVPTDLVIDPSNRLFVAASNAGRLEVFGIDDFADPEAIVPAAANVDPGTILRGCADSPVAVTVAMPGQRLEAISHETVRANGVAPTGEPTLVDPDGDGLPELRFSFRSADLLATLGDAGPADLTVTGAIAGLAFEARTTVHVAAAPDEDDDGLCDRDDACAGSLAGEPVDASGCSIDQKCPCRGPQARTPWPRRHAYSACVRRAAAELAGSGTISEAAQQQYVASARAGSCGGLCPEREIRDLAGVWSCIDRLCPCRGPAPDSSWGIHREYVRCVRRRARRATRAGMVQFEGKRAVVREAVRSACGRERR